MKTKLDYPNNVYQVLDLATVPDDAKATIAYVLINKDIKLHDIIIKRYMNNKTLDEVGKDYDVTAERIRQLERRAFNLLRKHIDILNEGMDAFISNKVTAAESKAYNSGYSSALAHIEAPRPEKLVFDEFLENDVAILGIADPVVTKLKRNKCYTVGDICEHTRAELLSFRGFGVVTTDYIISALEKNNLHLKTSPIKEFNGVNRT